MKQQTIKNAIDICGIGIHSGKNVNMSLKPAPENTGIVFRRLDDEDFGDVKVTPEVIQEAPLCTLLVDGENQISTIEHLMSALSALNLDNLIIELDGPEVPVMDGSAEPFFFALKSAGVSKQEADQHVIVVTKAIRVEKGDSYAELLPYDGLKFELSIDFAHPAIANSPQSVSFEMEEELYLKTVSRARTFGKISDLEMLHKNNKALGASLENAIGLDDNTIVNEEGLRYKDEFVRHKLLDAIGDLYVAGAIKGYYKAHKPSHALNNQLLRALLKE